MHIKEWIQYQNILQKIEKISFQNKKEFEKLQTIDYESSYEFMHESNEKLLLLSLNIFKKFHVNNPDLIKIKKYWIEIYTQLHGSSELDYGDLEEISDLHDHINQINEKLEKNIYLYFKNYENCPVLILDWILYTTLQNDISKHEKELAKEHVLDLMDYTDHDSLESNCDFIIKNLEDKNKIIQSNFGSTPKFFEINQKLTQLNTLKTKMNLNRIQNLSLENEFRGKVDEIENQIKSLEIEFFCKTLSAMELTDFE